MTRVIVKDLANAEVAVVRCDASGAAEVVTDDDAVRGKLERAIARGRRQGLAHRSYRRVKTATGVKHQILGRWAKPENTDFPQALADYLANEDLIAYAEEDAGT